MGLWKTPQALSFFGVLCRQLFELHLASMLAQQVHDWITQAGPFAKGLRYASQLGVTLPSSLQNVQVVFASHRAELVKLLKPYAAAAAPAPTGHIAHVSGDTEPEAVALIRLQLRDIYKQYALLKGELRSLALTNSTDQARYEVAERIMLEIIPRIDDLSAKLKTYERTGILPSFSDRELVRLTVEKMKQLANMESRVSRLKGWLKKGEANGEVITTDKRGEYEREVADKQTRIDALKLELDA